MEIEEAIDTVVETIIASDTTQTLWYESNFSNPVVDMYINEDQKFCICLIEQDEIMLALSDEKDINFTEQEQFVIKMLAVYAAYILQPSKLEP